MQNITISQASIADLKALINLSKETFIETYADKNTEANTQKFLQDNFNEEKLGTELNNPVSLFYMVWDMDMAVGYIKLNIGNAQTEPQGYEALELERIYIKNSHQGKKIGRLLYEKAAEVGRLRHKTWIWLGVWEKNPKAKAFYEKLGFVAFDSHLFMVGDEAQTDILMRKQI